MLACVTPIEIGNIGSLLRPDDILTRKTGRDLLPKELNRELFTPEFQGWYRVAIYVCATEPSTNLADLVLHSNTFALHKDLESVVSNGFDHSELKRFGFRCERTSCKMPAVRDARRCRWRPSGTLRWSSDCWPELCPHSIRKALAGRSSLRAARVAEMPSGEVWPGSWAWDAPDGPAQARGREPQPRARRGRRPATSHV